MADTDHTLPAFLRVVDDLLNGRRHSRNTIARAAGKSLPTADRWVTLLREGLTGVKTHREGRTLWISLPMAGERTEVSR